jgi:hypothetical protein
MFIDNPLTNTQMLLIVLWRYFEWFMVSVSNLKPIEWQDECYEMFYIVDFAML